MKVVVLTICSTIKLRAVVDSIVSSLSVYIDILLTMPQPERFAENGKPGVNTSVSLQYWAHHYFKHGCTRR